MLEGITVALQSYYDTANGAKNILESAVAQIKANYIGAMLAEKMKEAQEIYNNTLAESRKTNFDACIAILDDVANQARKVVEVSVVGAYKNNYFAYRAICDILKIAPKPVTIDEIIAELGSIRNELHQYFYSDNIEGYHFRNMKDGIIISSSDDVFRAFIEGRFEDAVQNEADKE